MIVKDEKSNLDRLLATCHHVFDEIIIVDTGSKDRTKDIAEKYKARIFDFEWVDDFAKARNFAFHQATGQFLMWLDADDYIYPAEAEKIKSLKAALSPTKNCYKLVYKYNGEISGYNFRIVRKCPEIFWKYPCHETLILPDGSQTEECPITVEHWGSWKPGRDSVILKKAYEGEWKDDGRMQFYYIRDIYYHGEYEKAIEMYQKHLYNIPWYTRYGAYYFYADSCFKTGRHLKAVDLCMKAVRERPVFSDFCCLLGRHYMECGKYMEAKKWYEKALGNAYPQDASEIFMAKSNYWSEPTARLKTLEKVLASV
jgi:glycosyltransferase involved in cell wall biosynthesis